MEANVRDVKALRRDARSPTDRMERGHIVIDTVSGNGQARMILILTGSRNRDLKCRRDDEITQLQRRGLSPLILDILQQMQQS